MTLRQRLFLNLVPSLVILAALGAGGIVLLYRVSARINAILRENYDSVVAMVGLNEALERIDSSFTFALLGDEEKARESYAANARELDRNLDIELNNITILPREQELADDLVVLWRKYRKAGDTFFSGKLTLAQRQEAYLRGGPEGHALLRQFQDIKKVTEEIRQLNQHNMEEASADARKTAAFSLVAFAAGLAVAGLASLLLTWRTVRSILRPIQDLTLSARAIEAGNLDQVVPVPAHDEVGELAAAFNRMTRQLRGYRRSHLDRLLRAQRTSQATIDSFADPVLVIDPEGRVEMANPSARQLLGLPDPASAGPGSEPPVWHPPEALAGPLRAALEKQVPFLTQAFDQTLSFRLAGEERSYLPQVLPIRDPYGGTLGAGVVLNDVTRFRLLDQIKGDLVATVSHELKTPLTSVRLVLHLLLEETVGSLTPKQTELLLDARDNAERLLTMIEHLLALARLEQGRDRLAVQSVAVVDLLRGAADAAAARAEAAHVSLAVESAPDLPPVAADPQQLAQALNNLLDNALAYTPPGGHITLAAELADGDRVRLTVADTGAGIPPEYLPHVFQKFFRVPGQSRGGGTGLGLAIVREVVSAHHGSVTCDSAPGKGTVFRLTLPTWKEVIS